MQIQTIVNDQHNKGKKNTTPVSSASRKNTQKNTHNTQKNVQKNLRRGASLSTSKNKKNGRAKKVSFQTNNNASADTNEPDSTSEKRRKNRK